MNGNVKIPCEVYSRIVGYFRPVSRWNPGKAAEFQQREMFMPVVNGDGCGVN